MWSSPDTCPLSGVTGEPPTVSISFSDCRMFFSTWSALVCMREMSMAKSLAWVLHESTDRHQRHFNIQQSRRAVLCTHVVLLWGCHRQLILGWGCFGLSRFLFQFFFPQMVPFRRKPLLLPLLGAKGEHWLQEQEVSLFDLYLPRTS